MICCPRSPALPALCPRSALNFSRTLALLSTSTEIDCSPCSPSSHCTLVASLSLCGTTMRGMGGGTFGCLCVAFSFHSVEFTLRKSFLSSLSPALVLFGSCCHASELSLASGPRSLYPHPPRCLCPTLTQFRSQKFNGICLWRRLLLDSARLGLAVAGNINKTVFNLFLKQLKIL